MSRPLTPVPARKGQAGRSRWLLGAALAATLLAVFWPVAEQGDEADGSQPLRRSAAPASAVAQAGAPAVLAAAAFSASASASASSAGRPSESNNTLPDRSRYASAAVLHDPFATPALPVAASAAAPVAAPVLVEAPPKPVLPWQFGGRLQVADQPDAVLLNDSTRTHTLAVGQALEGWRLDADRGSSLDFTHLASGHRQSLALTP